MESLSRKELRKRQQVNAKSQLLKRHVALLGTTLSAVSIVAPFQPFMVGNADTILSGYRSMDSATFIETAAAHAQPIAEANDLYASVMIAQAIVESAWGNSELASAPNYNLFGIKGSYQGQTVYFDTLEYLNGKWVTKKEPFRKYPSYAESFADNAWILKNVSLQAGTYYYSGAWKSNTTSYRDATAWLTGRYATDPNYGSKLNNIIETYQLTRFDSGKEQTSQNNSNSSTNQSQTTTYTVKAGDSLWVIASRFGVSVTQLKSWNQLKNDVIYVGQKLVVKKGVTLESAPVTTPQKPVTTTPQKPTTTISKTHTVKAGESLWIIANRYSVTINNLKSWNQLKNDTIFIGQKLKVKKPSTATVKPSGTTSTPKPNTTTKPNTATKPTISEKPATSSTYTVKSGDSLWIIANRYGVTINNLKSWNQLKTEMVFVGQKLKVKKPNATTVKPAGTTTKPTTTSKTKTVTVKSGDSLWAIATKHNLSVPQLKKLNQLTSDIIYVGQKLKVHA